MKDKRRTGRPKIKDTEKVKVVSAYLKTRENKAIVKHYGSLTKAIRLEVLPKCEVA